MKIQVRVKPQAKETAVERRPDGSLLVKVKEPARKGRANEAVCAALARHFRVPKQAVEILRGSSARGKLVHIRE